jgi:Homeodomain-like domain
MIRCGWCHAATPDNAWCAVCSHPDPRIPWEQRNLPVPVLQTEGRPSLDEQDVRHRYAEAKASLEAEGRSATVEAIAERLDRSPRTVREWRARFSLR